MSGVERDLAQTLPARFLFQALVAGGLRACSPPHESQHHAQTVSFATIIRSFSRQSMQLADIES